MPPSFKKMLRTLRVPLLHLLPLVLLMWQLGVAAPAQSQGASDAKLDPSLGKEASKAGTAPVLSNKKILILHSFEGNAPIFLGTDKGLSNTVQSGGITRLNQFFESLDLRRNPGLGHRKLLVEQMRMRYGHRKLDMIITMYPEALEFVLQDCRDALPDVPIPVDFIRGHV